MLGLAAFDKRVVLVRPGAVRERFAAQKESYDRDADTGEHQQYRAPIAGDAKIRHHDDPEPERDNTHLFGHAYSLLPFNYHDKLATLLLGIGGEQLMQLLRRADERLFVHFSELAVQADAAACRQIFN